MFTEEQSNAFVLNPAQLWTHLVFSECNSWMMINLPTGRRHPTEQFITVTSFLRGGRIGQMFPAPTQTIVTRTPSCDNCIHFMHWGKCRTELRLMRSAHCVHYQRTVFIISALCSLSAHCVHYQRTVFIISSLCSLSAHCVLRKLLSQVYQ